MWILCESFTLKGDAWDVQNYLELFSFCINLPSPWKLCPFPLTFDWSTGEACLSWSISHSIQVWPHPLWKVEMFWCQSGWLTQNLNKKNLRRPQHNAWHWIAQNIVCYRAHITIVFHNQRFSVVRIFDHWKLSKKKRISLQQFSLDYLMILQVNLTSIRSLAFSGFRDTGHSIVGSGFSDLLIIAAGVWLGAQKLGSSFSLPLAMFDIVGTLLLLVPGWSVRR